MNFWTPLRPCAIGMRAFIWPIRGCRWAGFWATAWFCSAANLGRTRRARGLRNCRIFKPRRGKTFCKAAFCIPANPNLRRPGFAARDIEKLGEDLFARNFVAWADRWGEEPRHEINEAVWKSLVWSASLLNGAQIAEALGKVALSAAQKGEPNHANHRTKSPPVFNASLWSLSQKSDGLPVLQNLKGEIKQKSLNNSLEKAIVDAQSRV